MFHNESNLKLFVSFFFVCLFVYSRIVTNIPWNWILKLTFAFYFLFNFFRVKILFDWVTQLNGIY
jgi:hypothetical protein